ncbi:FAD-dependent oxidoreductase [Chloroflexota bacterium]
MNQNTAFPELFTPGYIGNLCLKNRIVMPPISTGLATIDGEASPELADFLGARAAGGAAIIFVEVTVVAPAIDKRKQLPRMLRLDDDGYISGLGNVAEAVHEAGAKACLQLSPGFSSAAAGAPWKTGETKQNELLGVSPSGVSLPGWGQPTREITEAEIEAIIMQFGQAARRAAKASFDMIEIHSHGGFLSAQFLSPYFNHRKDDYGGTPEKRLAFLRRIIGVTRQSVGPNFPITVKYSVDEYIEGGRSLEEGQAVAVALAEAGVNGITVSSGILGNVIPSLPSMYHASGCMEPLAKAIKQVVSIPVLMPGKTGNPQVAENILAGSSADFIGWGRPLVADPELPTKTATGNHSQARQCLYCNECSRVQMLFGSPIRCTVNPVAGRERQYTYVHQAKNIRKVVVVGGGPAGMEAALTAGQRGHDVEFYEQNQELGSGQLKLATLSPHKEGLKTITSYYTAALKPLNNVRLHLGKKATAAEVMKTKPDAVIVATGATGNPGAGGIDAKYVVTAHDVLSGKVSAGANVVVVGGGLVGCEVACLLAAKNKKVTLLEMMDMVAATAHGVIRAGLLAEMKELGVNIFTGVCAEVLDKKNRKDNR